MVAAGGEVGYLRQFGDEEGGFLGGDFVALGG